MKLKGRRQSTNVEDRTNDPDTVGPVRYLDFETGNNTIKMYKQNQALRRGKQFPGIERIQVTPGKWKSK